VKLLSVCRWLAAGIVSVCGYASLARSGELRDPAAAAQAYGRATAVVAHTIDEHPSMQAGLPGEVQQRLAGVRPDLSVVPADLAVYEHALAIRRLPP